MPSVTTKRKHEGSSALPSSKFRKDGPNSRHPSANPPIGDKGLLPSLPAIDDQYRDVVFTHSSTAGSNHTSYDRLEFLGDAYLELISSQLIFERLPQFSAGRMSQVRESMVKNETLGQYSVLYGLDRQLKEFKRLRNESASAWLKIKGDIFEAYVAAVVLSHPDGFSVAKKWLIQLWEPKIEAALSKPVPSTKSKEELAKKILGTGVKIDYVDERKPVIHYGQGTDTYYVGVYLTGWGWENQYLGSGKGLSRAAAGQAAAAAAMENHPLIDEIVAKRTAFYEAKKTGAAQPQQTQQDTDK